MSDRMMSHGFMGKSGLRATLSLAALTAVSGAFMPQARAADELVRLGNLKLAHFAAVSYIKELKDCGIKVDERTFAKGPDIMQGIVAGEIDVGATASEAAISGRAAGAPIYIVAGFAKGGARLLSRADLNLKTIEALKGHKVGVTRGSIQELLLGAELAKHNMTSSDQPGKDVQIVYLGYPDLNQALATNNVDAIMQSEPYSAQAINKKTGTEIMKPYDTAIGEPVRTLVMSQDFHDKHRATAEKFMRCFVRATKTFIEQPTVAQKYVSETLFKGQVSKQDFEDAISNSPYTYNITAEHIQISTDLMAKYGIGKMAKPPKATDWVKLDLLNEAKKALNVP